MTDQNKALLVTVADPFNAFKSRKLVKLEVGKTICETLVEQGYVSMTADGMTRNGYFFVTLNGEAVLQADWNTVINDEDCLGIWTLPQGGGGGSNIGAIIITVVMVAAAVFTGGATLGVALAWGAAAGAAVGLLSSMVPAPSTPSSGSSIGKDTASSTYTISAQGNSVRVGEAIPSQYGRMRVWPDLAAQPYTEIRGNEQYVYQLMVLGQGAYEVERIQIEDSDIKAYGEVQWEVIQPNQQVTLFPDNVITSQAVQGLEMLAPDEQGFAVLGPYVSSPPGVKVNFIAVDIQLPQGAYKVDDEGNNLPRSVQISFWTQPINDAGAPAGAQIQIVSETLTFSTKTPQMISYKVAVPEGRYQTSGQRTSNKPVDNRTVDKVIWSGLKGYGKSARTFGNVTMLATIIKATNNLNSNTSRRINVIQTRKLPTWDPVNGWKAEVATANPAWAYADALRNADYGPAWGTNRINMSEIYRLSQVWAARKDEFNGIFDTRTTLWQALTQIAMVGRATPQYYAGVMDLIRDEPKTIPAQIFGPGQILQNTFKGSYKLGTSQTPDHVIVKFWNRETWQEDEVTCVLPGSTTKVPYTKDMTFGITDRDHAWREGMYAAAVNRDQRSRNSFTTEMEGLLLRFGDLIHVTHDVPGWGLPGKVVSFNPTTGKIVTTEPLTFSAAATHYITFRKKNGKADGPWPIIADPNPVAGVNSAIVQGTVANRQKIFISNGVTTDLTSYAFGPADRESNKMVVLSAKPNANGETQLTVCDYVTSPHIADQGGDVPPPGPISNLPGQPVGPIVNSVRVEMTTTVGEQQIVADPANGAIYYEFEGMRQGGANWSAFGVSGDPFLFVNLDSGPWIIRVRAVGAIPGPWATWTGNIAATSLPLAKLSKFVATGKIFAIDLSFDYAEETRSIAKTLEIWAGRTNVLGNSTLLVKLPYPATAYTHSVNRGADQWYYFARVIDSAGRVGPWFNNGGGIPGMSSMDADPILDQIAGEVTKDILGQELQKEIELITAPSTVVGSVNQRVEQVRTDLNKQVQDLSTVVGQNKQDIGNIKQDISKINSDITTISKAGLYQSNLTYAAGKTVRSTDDRLYTAIKAVPVNTPPPNTTYWLDVGQVAINENGSAAKINQTITRVDQVERTQTAQATTINGLRTDVDGKASQTAFNSLSSDVTKMGDTVSAQGRAITSLTTEVDKKVSNTAFNALTTRVDDVEGVTRALGSDVTQLKVTVNTTQPFVAGKSWEFINSAQGWYSTATGGVFAPGPAFATASKTGNIQCVFSPTVSGVENPYVRFRLRRRNTTRISCRMYWANEDGGLAEARGISWTLKTDTTDWQDIEINLTDTPAWSTKTGIYALRLDVMNIATDTSGEVDIAYVAIGRRSVAASAEAVSAMNTVVIQQGQQLSSQSDSLIRLSNDLTTTNNNVDKAQQAAKTASDLAGGKGKVLFGTSAPAVADRLPQNLWIDMTGNANTPKRWNGSTWSAVTDKVATDAAAAAASALDQVATKAEASTVSNLTNTVTQMGQDVTAQGGAITRIDASLLTIGSENLLYNPSLDVVNPTSAWLPDGWALGNAGTTDFKSFMVASTLDPTGRALRLEMTIPGVNNYVDLVQDTPKWPGASQGQILTLSGHFRATNGFIAQLYVQWRDSTGANIRTDGAVSQNASVAPEGWQRFSLTTAAGPTGAASVRIIFRCRGPINGASTTGFIEWDRLQLEEGASMSGWRDNNKVNASDISINATATTNLTARVKTAEDGLTSVSGSVTLLENSLGDIGGENLFYNPTFTKAGGTANAPDGWTAEGPATYTASVVPSWLNSGEKAFSCNATVGTINSGQPYVSLVTDQARAPRVAPGQTVTSSVYARKLSGAGDLGLRIYHQWFNSSNSVINAPASSVIPLTVAGGRISFTSIAPANAAYVRVFIRAHTTWTSNASGTFELARPQCEYGSKASGWRDNGQVNALGVAANSTALTNLGSTVTQQGLDISAVATKTTNLETAVYSTTNGLATKASGSALNDLSTRVDATERGLTSVATSVTNLEAKINTVGSFVAGMTWEFTGSLRGWYASGTGATLTAGPLFATLVKPSNLQCNFTPAFSGSENPFMRIRLRRRNTTRSTPRMYFANQDGGLSEARRQDFTISLTTTDWQDIEIDLSQTAGWVGKNMTTVRLDLTNGGDTNAEVDIAYVAVGRRSAAASAQALSQTVVDVSNLDGKITAQITRIDGLYTSVGEANTAIQDERTARINADGALGQRIDTTQSNINGVSANVQTISTAQTNLQNQANASFAVKLGVTSNGIYYASGFGTSLVNNQGVIQSTFAVLTDRFVVLNTTNNTLVSPFSIVNGQVIIRDALISSAAIRNAIIGATLRSASMTNWPTGAEPIMTQDFNIGNVITRHPTRSQTYSVMDAAGIRVVVDGVLRVRMGLW